MISRACDICNRVVNLEDNIGFNPKYVISSRNNRGLHTEACFDLCDECFKKLLDTIENLKIKDKPVGE